MQPAKLIPNWDILVSVFFGITIFGFVLEPVMNLLTVKFGRIDVAHLAAAIWVVIAWIHYLSAKKYKERCSKYLADKMEAEIRLINADKSVKSMVGILSRIDKETLLKFGIELSIKEEKTLN